MIPLKNTVPSRYPPTVTWMLIAANCLVFLFQNSLSPLELEMFLRDLRSYRRDTPRAWLTASSPPKTSFRCSP
jgi:hypothetical protein